MAAMSKFTSHQSVKTSLSIIQSSDYLSLGTSSNGQPWVSPLYFAVTPELDFVAISAVSSRHARNLRSNQSVSWCIFLGSEPPESTDGVYFEGIGEEVEPDQAQALADILYDRRFPDPKERADHPANPEYWESTGRRLYRFHPTNVSKVDLDDPAGVSRSAVPLDLLKSVHLAG
jgi:uncharacterized protein YhbP (UPF0306 family)